MEEPKNTAKVKKLSRNMVLMRSRGDSIDSVKKLNLWGQGITDVSLVAEMPELEVVTLSLNNVDDLEAFSSCANLQQLYLRSNKISDLKQICHLKELDNLGRLWLSDNPCTELLDYRQTVIKTLPQLSMLDDTEITEEEREDASAKAVELSLEDNHVNESVNYLPEIKTELEEGEDTEDRLETVQQSTETDTDTAMSLDGFNKLRTEIGLPPLNVSKHPPTLKPGIPHNPSADYEVRTAVLHLIKVLDKDSLEVVMEAIKYRMRTEFSVN